MVCQRCLLNTMSNRTMLASTDCGTDNHRFISQRQYKRKLRKDCPSYATIERKSMKIKKNGEKSNSKDEDDEEMDQDTAGKWLSLHFFLNLLKQTHTIRSILVFATS